MAGEAVLSTFMQVLFDKLYNTAAKELKSIWGVGKELDGLSTTLSIVQALLEDAEEKQLRNNPVRIWLSKLRDVAYEMDDLLDEYGAQHLRLEMEDRIRRRDDIIKVSSFLSPSYLHKCFYQYKAAHRIRTVRKKLDEVARERDILGLQVLGSTSRLEIAAEHPQTSSLVDDLYLFGRDEDSENIIKKLLSPGDYSSRMSFSVLPIVGMGGIGKTTVAQIVYNDIRVKKHFELRMWICVTENFDEMKLTRETLHSAVSGKLSAATSGFLSAATSGFLTAANTNMNLLQQELCDSLKGKRFLLVLDDVWNENRLTWERFCLSLRGAGAGSKVIVTTQNERVGMVMGGLPPYRLKRLPDSDCWNLFRNCAFVDGNSSGHPNLEKIGMEIVKKLKGLPLAAKSLGSLLYSKLDEEDWRNILRSEIWELPPDKNNILPALRLSYNHLPPHLKQCFAFCSVFHKDYIFRKEKLVQLWMALGYIRPQGRRRLEDIGNSYFDDLVSRSFFQPHKRSNTYVMHDAIHDLAQCISVGEYTRLAEDNSGQGQSNQNSHHLSYSCKNSGITNFEEFLQFKKLRTLLLLRGYKSSIPTIPKSLFVELKCLRVLDLYRRDITELPDTIGSLIQLRYLSLSGTAIQTLPSSISRLYSLQTLKLNHCDLLDEIPTGVTNLINLRHLEASTRLVSKIPSIGRLIHLQQLEEFTVHDDKRFSIKELKDMAELHGQLCIRNLEKVRTREEAGEANLSNKENLSVLYLNWTDDQGFGSLQPIARHEEVLAGLEPHTKLKELRISGYAGASFPTWLWSSSLSCLETIYLSDCRKSRLLPPLGQLPFLEYLYISGSGVIEIGREFYGEGEVKGFPLLKELLLEDMPNLERWLCAEGNHWFPRLEELEVTECPKLIELHGLPSTLKRFRLYEVGLAALPKIRHPDCVTQSTLLSLQIHNCPRLGTLQQGLMEQQLTFLEELMISNCEELTTLPVECFRPLINLRSLYIDNCPKLMVEDSSCGLLPNSLKDLQISSCSSLVGPLLTGLRRITSLTNLRISDCSGFNCFPDNVLPPSLKSFGIRCCDDLQFLPEDLIELSSLETLIIDGCRQIASLPDKGLPPMLRELFVQDCPLLRLDHKIAYVPVVEVDGHKKKEYASDNTKQQCNKLTSTWISIKLEFNIGKSIGDAWSSTTVELSSWRKKEKKMKKNKLWQMRMRKEFKSYVLKQKDGREDGGVMEVKEWILSQPLSLAICKSSMTQLDLNQLSLSLNKRKLR